jgi:4-alpha-glucanotransferase
LWWDWPTELRDRDPATLRALVAEHAGTISTFVALQYLFDRFWAETKVRQGGGQYLVRAPPWPCLASWGGG